MPRNLFSKQSTCTEPPSLPSREAHERALDETLSETFPASDPLSSIPDPVTSDLISGDSQAA